MSGLIVDTREQPGLEVVPPSTSPPKADYYKPYELPVEDPPAYAKPARARICGLVARTFWIVFAIVLVILVVGIGAGIGGGLAAANKTKHATAVAHTTGSTPTTAGVATGTPISTSSVSSSLSTSSATSTSSASSSKSSASSSTSSSASSTGTSSAIAASSTQPGVYRIINIASNTAVDLLNGNPSNNSQIEGWVWDPASTPSQYVHQSWLIASVGNGAVTIMNTEAKCYITVPSTLTAGTDPLSTPNNAAVYGAVPGNPSDPHSQWIMTVNTDKSISFFSKAFPTKVLDLTASNPANGTLLLAWEKIGGLNQEWRLLAS